MKIKFKVHEPENNNIVSENVKALMLSVGDKYIMFDFKFLKAWQVIYSVAFILEYLHRMPQCNQF